MKHALLVTALLAGLAAGGCGYALVGRGTNIPADVHKIYVQPLDNETTRSQIDQILTRAISDELVTRQRLTVVASADESDAELSGAVTNFGVTPVTFDTEGRATEYEISIQARFEFKRHADDTVLWHNDSYVFRDTYPVDVSEAGYFDREKQAIEKVSEKFGETVVTDLLEGF